MVTSFPAPRSSHPAASPASLSPRMTTRFPLVWRASTLCGNAQLKSEERDSPPTANPDSFTNSRRLTFISPAILSCLYFSPQLARAKVSKESVESSQTVRSALAAEPDWSECFLLHIVQLGIWNKPAVANPKVFNVLQHEARYTRSRRGFDPCEIRCFDVVEEKCWPQVFLHELDVNVAHFNVLHMTDVEAVRRHGAEPAGFGIVIFQFGGLDPGIFHCAAALVLHINVAELQIFNVMAGDAGDDRGLPRCTVVYDYIADDYAPQPAYGSALGTAHAAAQPEK